jgi:dTMP kinase
MSPPEPGRLIALEGIDGCGKSTQAAALAERLGARLTREPGATELGQALRHLLLDPGGPAMTARAEALLMVADRAQHVAEVIRPALVEGRWVVTDRFSGSTLAYQGWGRGLGPGPLRPLVSWGADGVEPDLSILLDVDLAVARHRLGAAAADRLEGLGAGFFEQVRAGFLAQAAEDPAHWAVIDGRADAASVAAVIAEVVEHRLGRPAAGAEGAR